MDCQASCLPTDSLLKYARHLSINKKIPYCRVSVQRQCVTDGLTTFWRLPQSITVQTHSNTV